MLAMEIWFCWNSRPQKELATARFDILDTETYPLTEQDHKVQKTPHGQNRITHSSYHGKH